MADKNKGIILSNPMERYIDLDHSYLYKPLGIKVIPKNERKSFFLDEDTKDKKIINPNIDSGMVILINEDDKNNLYLVVNRSNNEIEVMHVVRTTEQLSKRSYKIIKKMIEGITDYVRYDKLKKIDVKESYQLEYIASESNYYRVIRSYENGLNKKVKYKNISKYEFGDVLSIYGVKGKRIFVCQNGRFIYTCSFDSFELFTGMDIYSEENVIDVHDKLDDNEKEKLLSKLKCASQNEKHIPRKAQTLVKKLVKNRK